MKQNKFLYGWKILVNYGQGWEWETWEDSWKEAKARLREYRENAPQYPVKATRGRIINHTAQSVGVGVSDPSVNGGKGFRHGNSLSI
jgi:hypothetical protein